MIFLFTDFGSAGPYVGQVKAVLNQHAPKVPVIDLVHDAPPFNIKAGAHLLAALAAQLPPRSVALTVVDPGVGGSRAPVAVLADGRWFVGPDNGLISVVAARAAKCQVHSIGWRPAALSASFHGRDLFAPVCAMLARGNRKSPKLEKARLAADFGAGDLAEVIYVDHFGSAMTGLRAAGLPRASHLDVAGRRIARAGVFSDARPGELFCYENSLGLIEIAANRASAAAQLGLGVGAAVSYSRDP